MASDSGARGAAITLDEQVSGLDALDLAEGRTRRRLVRRVVAGGWPKLLAVALALLSWQLVVWSGWRPPYALPGPATVAVELWREAHQAQFWIAIAITLRRAVTGFAVAVALGSVLGALVSRVRPLRAAVGSLITGLQSMPSIAWFPLAILLFQLSESAITFVVVLGAAPSIANGLISGVDYVPPLLVRAGRVLGLRGLGLYRSVILPASLPSYVAGLKQGWAFAWRSLMAGELIVIVAHRPSIGVRLQYAREFNDAAALLASMIVILVIGIVIDQVFGAADHAIRRRFGLSSA